MSLHLITFHDFYNAPYFLFFKKFHYDDDDIVKQKKIETF